jgi:hypothetical protein
MCDYVIKYCQKLYYLTKTIGRCVVEGLERATFRVAVPKTTFAPIRCAVLTAAPLPPRFFSRRERSASKQVIRLRAHNPTVITANSNSIIKTNTLHKGECSFLASCTNLDIMIKWFNKI